MTALLQRIEQEAKQLSREDRERLVADLVAGLDEAPLSEIDQAWVEEAERRYDDWVAGRVKGIPASKVFSGIRRELGWKR
jgi:putative addiction module component (TIGR02574 family)